MEKQTTRIDTLIGKRDLRVAVYRRTMPEDTLLDNTEYWKSYIAKNGWTFAGIYCDEGNINESRDNLLFACRKKRIDLILVRSISKLDRDLITVLSIVTELAGINPGVGIYCVDEDWYSLDSRDYMLLLEITDMVEETNFYR